MIKSILWKVCVVVVLVACGYIGLRYFTDVSFSTSHTSTTATRIDKIKEIGEWEFLSIHTEEMVEARETKEHKYWFNEEKQLIRIYPATLHIGFDLKKDTKEGWIKANGDTIDVVLPHTHLLDERFVDEAASRSVIEDGSWMHKDRDMLLKKAEVLIKKKYLTSEKLQHTDTVAKQQVEQFLQSIGFKVINIKFQS